MHLCTFPSVSVPTAYRFCSYWNKHTCTCAWKGIWLSEIRDFERKSVKEQKSQERRGDVEGKEKKKCYIKEYLNRKLKEINIKCKVINYLTLQYVIKIPPVSPHIIYKLIRKLPCLTNNLIWKVLNNVQETTWPITSDNRFSCKFQRSRGGMEIL